MGKSIALSCLASFVSLKQGTIPQFELAAVTVSICLNKVLKHELEIPIDTISFWPNSMTVLHYIRNEGNESRRFHTYIANCAASIREDSSPLQERYMILGLIVQMMHHREPLQSLSLRMTTG